MCASFAATVPTSSKEHKEAKVWEYWGLDVRGKMGGRFLERRATIFGV